jgi:hypothetical protein
VYWARLHRLPENLPTMKVKWEAFWRIALTGLVLISSSSSYLLACANEKCVVEIFFPYHSCVSRCEKNMHNKIIKWNNGKVSGAKLQTSWWVVLVAKIEEIEKGQIKWMMHWRLFKLEFDAKQPQKHIWFEYKSINGSSRIQKQWDCDWTLGS